MNFYRDDLIGKKVYWHVNTQSTMVDMARFPFARSILDCWAEAWFWKFEQVSFSEMQWLEQDLATTSSIPDGRVWNLQAQVNKKRGHVRARSSLEGTCTSTLHVSILASAVNRPLSEVYVTTLSNGSVSVHGLQRPCLLSLKYQDSTRKGHNHTCSCKCTTFLWLADSSQNIPFTTQYQTQKCLRQKNYTDPMTGLAWLEYHKLRDMSSILYSHVHFYFLTYQ